MRQSQLFYKASKEYPKEAEVISHKLLSRASYIFQLASGVYIFSPLGFLVHKKIENIIREEMNSLGAQEVFLPALQPKEIWLKTGRWDKMDPPLFVLNDRHKKEFALGSTHEEVMTFLAKTFLQSYKDLPFSLFQIQDKFRNEMRFTGGLLRTREFVMKDLYSFHKDEKDLNGFFDKVLNAYDNIFRRCGLNAIRSEASGGNFTEDKTYEFQVISTVGEDKIIHCPKCNWASNLEVASVKKCPKCGNDLKEETSIEVGHTFKLGTKYSSAFDLSFKDEKGDKKMTVMGCYGIGIGRLMATIVEINNDDEGIIWPEEVAPYKAHLVSLGSKESEKIYDILQKEKIEVLYDDRTEKTSGEKLVEADLIGIPYRLVVSPKTKDKVELKKRGSNKEDVITIKKAIEIIKDE